MPVTAETLIRHELAGLRARVVEAGNADLVGVSGRVVDETTNTIRLEGADRVRTVPKAGARFEFELPDGGYVTVDGARLVARPARRTELKEGSKWRSV